MSIQQTEMSDEVFDTKEEVFHGVVEVYVNGYQQIQTLAGDTIPFGDVVWKVLSEEDQALVLEMMGHRLLKRWVSTVVYEVYHLVIENRIYGGSSPEYRLPERTSDFVKFVKRMENVTEVDQLYWIWSEFERGTLFAHLAPFLSPYDQPEHILYAIYDGPVEALPLSNCFRNAIKGVTIPRLDEEERAFLERMLGSPLKRWQHFTSAFIHIYRGLDRKVFIGNVSDSFDELTPTQISEYYFRSKA